MLFTFRIAFSVAVPSCLKFLEKLLGATLLVDNEMILAQHLFPLREVPTVVEENTPESQFTQFSPSRRIAGGFIDLGAQRVRWDDDT